MERKTKGANAPKGAKAAKMTTTMTAEAAAVAAAKGAKAAKAAKMTMTMTAAAAAAAVNTARKTAKNLTRTRVIGKLDFSLVSSFSCKFFYANCLVLY